MASAATSSDRVKAAVARLRVADEVRAALTKGQAVVALESTLLAHGLLDRLNELGISYRWVCRYIPLDKDQRSNHTFGLMMIRRPGMKLLLDVFWPFIVWFTNGIFAEDRWICELEQAAFDAQGEDRNQEIFPAIRQLRKVLADNGVAMG